MQTIITKTSANPCYKVKISGELVSLMNSAYIMTLNYYADMVTTIIEVISAVLFFSELLLITIIFTTIRKYSFFKCFVFSGCFDLLAWSNGFQLSRHMGSEFTWYFTLNVLLSGFALHGHLLSNMLMTLNRFCAIVLPTKYCTVWNDRKCFSYFTVVVFLSFLSVCFRIGVTTKEIWIEECHNYVWLGYPVYIHVISLVVTVSICVFVSFGSIIINTWTFFHWRKKSKS
ncbi:hypothetical protein KIN20_015626 [Parelaphostrongylus tenuis]|uniref:7TM GPCR serpentine receptor class x (Srx) domain-containing protein n=1 Tax=Parelaphostrongylus tenuis TaxID=148309 RepID=A0AAD5N0J1_PARTN|nr:hypothetical protein KIN20_015626 [Parelaphostrongylus tenuis]